MRLTHRDYQRFNQAVVNLYRLAVVRGALQAISEVLPNAVGGFLAFANTHRPTGFDIAMSHPIQLPDTEENIRAFENHPRLAAGAGRDVIKISDCLSRAAWHSTELYHLSLPYICMEDDMGTDLRLPDGALFRACVIRDSRSFREEDRLMFSLLCPHIISLLSPPSVDSRVSVNMGLTKREQEVLHWIAEGKTNAEIGAILHIALGTVKIHLEHIYAKLGVENRHGAARKVFERQRLPS